MYPAHLEPCPALFKKYIILMRPRRNILFPPAGIPAGQTFKLGAPRLIKDVQQATDIHFLHERKIGNCSGIIFREKGQREISYYPATLRAPGAGLLPNLPLY